ncbi:hypothetical protein MBRA1_000365 [Malassezia brasiliensis]|uniref:RRM domain-containing protein n=1 Tax=Malassezia brasiliensis TaxID=1821822 RepID=A0AAF0DQU7_9BASI|nr:hypothetical protein MBRA1_000365 [Malassezia brasiliensis]
MTRRRPRFRVVVEPLRPSVTPAEIAQLFQPLEVRSVIVSQQCGRFKATVALYTQLDMEFACLRNNTMYAGYQLHVYPVCHDAPTEPMVPATAAPAIPPASTPAPRNLYVLNLPLEVTTVQLEKLFAAYGTVRHCVILSMLDGQARRRGFVDMDTAREAHDAMQHLQGRVWCGYPLEVSYARVQRSAADATHGPCSRIVISGLLPCATIDADDVRALVTPYAAVAHIDWVEPRANDETFAAQVTLVDAHDAERVVRALDGHTIVGQHLHVAYSITD